jgi:hypothetical protein
VPVYFYFHVLGQENPEPNDREAVARREGKAA